MKVFTVKEIGRLHHVVFGQKTLNKEHKDLKIFTLPGGLMPKATRPMFLSAESGSRRIITVSLVFVPARVSDCVSGGDV